MKKRRVITLKEIISEDCGKKGMRGIGKILGNKVEPGACVDLKDFIISHGFVNEFVKTFSKRFKPELLDSIEFINGTRLFFTLLEIMKKRYMKPEQEIKQPGCESDFEFPQIDLCEVIDEIS